MTDRELLELAAKAAGFFRYNCNNSIAEDKWGSGYRWNPLTDDGDALRLAVKLAIEPRFGDGIVTAACHGAWEEVSYAGFGREEATRRAIVRAAAEIGKGMK